MTESKGKFSIILPVYNVEKYLERCIKSILKQTYTNFELICVNDASPDKSQEILETWAKTDDRIFVINNPENKGLGASRNIALEKANGEFLTCIDSDDWVEPEFLESFLEGFEHKVDSVWIKPWKYLEKLDLATIDIVFPRFVHRLEGFLTVNPDNILNFPAWAWNKCYKTDLVKKNHFQWMENVYFEDMYFYYEYFINYPNVWLTDKLLYYYRSRETSIVGRADLGLTRILDMFKVLSRIYELIDEKNYNKEFKKSIIMSVNRFKTSYEYSKFGKETVDEYKKFMTKYNIK